MSKVLEDAARDGDVGAAWELGGMYADGDGVEQSDQRAFEYFRTLTDSHAEETPDTAPAVFVAQAFVAIGFYYLTGVANYIKPDAVRAQCSRIRRPILGIQTRSVASAARISTPGYCKESEAGGAGKGQFRAQAGFVAMRFKGEYVPRDAVRGLMYLMLGSDAASSGET
jgi:uncharacterized protein